MIKLLLSFVLASLFTLTCSLPLDTISERGLSNKVDEYGDKFEGDMVLTQEQIEAIFSPARNGLILEKYRWPNKTVAYQLNANHTKEQQDFIEIALKKLESVSCLKFVRRTNEEKFVNLTAYDEGCYSSVGYQNKTQRLNLQKYKPGTGCFRLGTIMHEFLHALGFYHMQSAHDRDEYVTIHWGNIRSGYEHNFAKFNNTEVTNFNTTYDYGSVMHYSAYGFSKNGNATIVPVDESFLGKIGQREKLSEKDIFKLNTMYECDAPEPEPEAGINSADESVVPHFLIS
ncbi:seminal metalloprotease 1-like [Contarinia nasturtii]|uniref:seminal metalloprotease 1-like n=1 Tax=Contarinia nasturtii TaxID=265458 RepID=UPI0012D3A854|nr:seminal metalloprotease 1-like [Contarinia nasturtii]